ncbi:conserved hypothetical protein [Ricinus communis]|uniref:Uncharacterized protein n=1 Tax=Ricinus communis TaxID=3988 RepID=B9SWV3_RICCO|nr:conserved hypothetical protein [Ricinus communis]
MARDGFTTGAMGALALTIPTNAFKKLNYYRKRPPYPIRLYPYAFGCTDVVDDDHNHIGFALVSKLGRTASSIGDNNEAKA